MWLRGLQTIESPSRARVNDVSVSPSGRYLCSVTDDSTLTVYLLEVSFEAACCRDIFSKMLIVPVRLPYRRWSGACVADWVVFDCVPVPVCLCLCPCPWCPRGDGCCAARADPEGGVPQRGSLWPRLGGALESGREAGACRGGVHGAAHARAVTLHGRRCMPCAYPERAVRSCPLCRS